MILIKAGMRRQSKNPKSRKPKKARAVKNPVGSVKIENGKKKIKTEKGWKLMKGIPISPLNKAKRKPIPLKEREQSPWKAHREYEEQVKKSVSDLIFQLFMEIRRKWLKAEGGFRKAEDELFRLNGKIYISPSTGKPLTKKQWAQVLKGLDQAFVRMFKNSPERLAKRALLLGKVLQGITYEQRQNALFTDLTIPKNIPDNSVWKNAELFGEHNVGELLVNLQTTARKNISTTILNAIQNQKTTKQLESDLFDDFTDLNRDWRRIAETEISTNVNSGILLSELEDKEEGETIFMVGISAGNACKYCIEHIQGQIVVLSDKPVPGGFITVKGVKYPAIWAGKNNVGKGVKEYWPTIPVHPHCRCSWTRYYPEMAELIIKKSLSLKGKYVILGKSLKRDKGEQETLSHIEEVKKNINHAIKILSDRGLNHDKSKLKSPEKEAYEKLSGMLQGVKYGSKEYKEKLSQIKPAIDHHYKNNSHHPEYYQDGIAGMNLFDIVEMVCDWYASMKRTKKGSIEESMKINEKRFKITPQLKSILVNTLKCLSEEENGKKIKTDN